MSKFDLSTFKVKHQEDLNPWIKKPSLKTQARKTIPSINSIYTEISRAIKKLKPKKE